jgi:GGDEF domain-containing protein
MPLSSHGVLGAYCSRHPQIRIWGCPAAESLEAGRAWTGGFMATIDRQELDRLTVLSSVFVLILASGLAAFMYPLVFVHPEGNKWTLRVAFFGFCALTMLFLGYLFERQNTFHRLKVQLLAELERNVALQIQASADLLRSMPDLNFFWDRLSMEFRRAQTMEKTLSLVLVKVRRNRKSESDPNAALSAAVKAMSRKLRPGDSIYRLAKDMFGVVLPETDTLNAKRVAVRLQEELQGVRAHFNCTFELTAHNYPEHVKSSHELEDIVKSMSPEETAEPAAVPVG